MAQVKPITVNDMFGILKQQLKLGNGAKEIYISDDDEGNGFHPLYFGFSSDSDVVKALLESTCSPQPDNYDDVVILG